VSKTPQNRYIDGSMPGTNQFKHDFNLHMPADVSASD